MSLLLGPRLPFLPALTIGAYFKQFPPTECFSSKDDDDEKTLTAAAEMDAENHVVAGSSLPM